jgi:hypothetical protein
MILQCREEENILSRNGTEYAEITLEVLILANGETTFN